MDWLLFIICLNICLISTQCLILISIEMIDGAATSFYDSSGSHFAEVISTIVHVWTSF